LDLTEKELMAAYVATIGKRIQSKLIYPEQARREESKGSARVSFTIQADGTLKPESLVVTESSGHELLDRKALKAVEFAAPFPSPPKKELSVTITVSFAIDR
jgi:protein TonB